jgi:hypothetical protein
VQVTGQRGKCRVIGKPLKELGDIGDPEGPFKTGFDLMQPFRKGQGLSWADRVTASGESRDRRVPHWVSVSIAAMVRSTSLTVMRATRITFFRLLMPPAMVTDERDTFKNSAKRRMQA